MESPSKTKKIIVTPGDGIGQEVVRQGVRVLEAIAPRFGLKAEVREYPVGGTAYDLTGDPLPDETLNAYKKADAILFGAVGGPKWDCLPYEVRPERALRLRTELGLYASLRPVRVDGDIASLSTLKPEILRDVDLMIVREFAGGIYFGSPRGVETKNGQRVGFNTLIYSEAEIKRVARKAFEVARKRTKRLTSVDKANILEATALWRNVVDETAREFPDVALNHLYVDNAAMQLIRNPRQFDTLLTSNLFGDILSDLAGTLIGSIGMLPSASLGDGVGLYEPTHGTAPKMAGQDVANPIGAILSVGLMFRYSFGLERADDFLRSAVARALETYRTKDIMTPGKIQVGCKEMGDRILEHIEKDSHDT